MTSKSPVREGNVRHSTPYKKRYPYDMLRALTDPKPGFEEARTDELKKRAASLKVPPA